MAASRPAMNLLHMCTRRTIHVHLHNATPYRCAAILSIQHTHQTRQFAARRLKVLPPNREHGNSDDFIALRHARTRARAKEHGQQSQSQEAQRELHDEESTSNEKDRQDDRLPPPPPPPPPRATLRDVGKGIFLAIQFFLLGHFISQHFYTVSLPLGPSMLPTMEVRGEWLLISHRYRYGKDIKVGDVIVAKHPLYPEGNMVIKRVVGMPGDFVWVPRHFSAYDEEGRYLGELEEEGGRGRMIMVPRGHCWLSGDNHEWSRDSRTYGAVPLGIVTGKVVWRLLPWRNFGRIENLMEEVEEARVER